MSYRTLVAAGMLAAASLSSSATILIPLDSQINNGFTYNSQSPTGDAIYTPPFDATQPIGFMSDASGNFVRKQLDVGGGWWYFYVDLNLAGYTTPGAGLDLGVAGSQIEFDTRYFQDPTSNSNPYSDAPVFARIYTYAADGDTYVGHRDYGIVYGTQAPYSNLPHPDWTSVTIDVNNDPFTDGGAFDIANVSRIRFYGTDWLGTGDDFVDFRNLKITAVPEPTTLATLGFLAAALLKRKLRRR